MDNEDALQMVEDCEIRESKLTDWERGFIDSVTGQLAQGKGLSPKQVETLESIWEKVTSRG